MTTEQRIKLCIERGTTYNPLTGIITGSRGEPIIAKNDGGYIRMQVGVNGKYYYFYGHQFAYYYMYNIIPINVDHRNGIRDDNRICNLRSTNHKGNCYNKTNTKGYHWDKKNNKWRVSIQVNYKTINIGRYNTEEEAKNAYLEAKEKYHIIKEF
jgi:hypothetical protein